MTARTVTRLHGAVLIAGLMLAGTAWAGESPDQEQAQRNTAQVAGVNQSARPAEASVAGTPDSAVSVQEKSAAGAAAVPGTEDVSKSDDVSKTRDAAGAVSSPKQEADGKLLDSDETDGEVAIADPIEPLNRAMFQFNDKLYFWALKPAARGYNAVVPEPVRVSVRNFFSNVKMPIRFVNSLLQGKFKGAGTELARFGINTVMGLAGFFDVAKSEFDLNPYDEDLGQTLGFYGMGELMYIVWPILGPSTVRDTVGYAGDTFLNPVSYITPFAAGLGVRTYEQINKTSLDLGTYEDLIEASIEPYIGVRDAFIQYRKKQIRK